MFLGTTAISEFWNRDEEILFLGTWCLRDDKRSDWESLRYHVLPCPWDDRERFYRAVEYLDQYGERLLGVLVEYLNASHAVSHGRRYWRVLLGPWLMHYLHSFYDRYVHLQEALQRHPNLSTIVLDARSFRTPKDADELVEFITGDPFNLQIFSQQLEGMGYSFRAKMLESKKGVSTDLTGNAHGPGITKGLMRWVCRAAIDLVGRSIGKRGHVLLHGTNWPRSQVWLLSLRSGFHVIPAGGQVRWTFTLSGAAPDEHRSGLGKLPADNEFERLCVASLPRNFPIVYLEGYGTAADETLARAQKVPPVLLSGIDWYFNEPFKFFAAEVSERGTHLIPLQHGGGYGILRSCPSELHERRLGKRFMTWGWAGPGSLDCRDLPSPALSSLLGTGQKSAKARGLEEILFVATAHPRYLYRFHSTPVGSQWSEYFEWECRYLDALPERLRRAVLFRPYPRDYGHGVRQRIDGRFPVIRWDEGGSLRTRLGQVRMVVIDHLMTTLLETLAANVPTVLFWDPCRWEVREEAAAYIEDLRSVGVLWDSPEKAAFKVRETYDDPWSWWGREEIQRVRQRFVKRYALARQDWLDYWVRALEEEVTLSRD